MAKVLITEKVNPSGPALLEAAGYEVVYGDHDEELIRKEIVDSDAVLVRVVKLDPEILSTAKNLKIVNKHGVGYDNIDTAYCKEHGIAVTTAPNGNTLSVVEHTIAMMLALAKNLIPVSEAYRTQGFESGYGLEGTEVYGKTLGLIGLGRIGNALANACRLGLGMNVIAYDPYARNKPDGIELVEDVNEIFRRSDVISLHCILTDETRKMVNRERLALVKPTATLINCARGAIVDEEALIEALQEGKLAGAGLDVTDPEPVDPDSPLFKMKNVIITPHYAPTTKECAVRVCNISAENIMNFLEGREPVGRIV